MNITPDKIVSLAEDEIFVFGSNLAGRHGAGAALLALWKFGAINGQGAGLMGKCYGIPTKDKYIKTLPLDIIVKHVNDFVCFAYENTQYKFLVTKVGCGLAGYKIYEMARLFFKFQLSKNIYLPKEFWDCQ